ncbi:MAG TPA: glycoside hydrolase family 3 N-terminal domain-containing protein [Bacteroidota bacterium]|nr:glycoside hydrolase family 3 N-terminal domain-containing protein [Bacteroidota bacterium]
MKFRRIPATVTLLCVVLVPSRTVRAGDPPPLPRAHDVRCENMIDSLLRVMTLEEKAGQLTQFTGWHSTPQADPSVSPEQRALIERGELGGIFNIWGVRATREAQQIAMKHSRLRIPLIFGLDVIHGYRTTFPIPLAEASAWDPAMVERDARIAAIEASASGVHWTFGPMVDIARDPRWGRIAEGSGEDPYLGSLLAAARVRGFQGGDPASDSSIAACAKHFAAYGGAEGGRDYNTVDVSERTLREVYLPPFHAAVDAGALTLMSSFNEIGGVPSTSNRWLMTDLLRGEWGFRGFVVSDWTSITELINHGVAADSPHAAALALNAGVDADLQSGAYLEFLPGLVREGKVSAAVLDEAVRRVLRVKCALGLFDDPYGRCSDVRERTEILTPGHIAQARGAGTESIVLLKNENGTLPLSRTLGSIAVIGPLAADSVDPLGPWDAMGRPSDVVTLIEGVRHAVAPSTHVVYAGGCTIDGTDRGGFVPAVEAARNADAVIVAVGESREMSGEAASRSSLGLPGVQEALVEAISRTGKPVVLVMMNGRPLSITREVNEVSAVLETWFLGVQSGNAIADVLFGAVNPSGKLPVTFPRSVGQVPFYYNHKNTGRPADDTVKYTSRYLDLPSTPLFPFGCGLSYTTFAYSGPMLSAAAMDSGGAVTISVRVKNTGSRAGTEIVQLYVRQDVGSVTRPVKELKGFRRVTIAPGESAPVEFTLKWTDLMLTAADGRRTVEPGRFTVEVGTNSRDVSVAHFTVAPPGGR